MSLKDVDVALRVALLLHSMRVVKDVKEYALHVREIEAEYSFATLNPYTGPEERVVHAHPEIPKVYAAYSEIAVEIMKYAWENNIRTEEILPDEMNYIELVHVNKTLFDLTAWTLGLYDDVAEHVLAKSRRRPNQSVEHAREFIEANFHRSQLTIDEVSERVFMNPTHLSKIFKREMKCSMIEYLTHLRMKKAKEILDQHPKLHIAEVAQQTGYDDPFYFSKLFKKVFGLSPSQYLQARSRDSIADETD